MNDLTRKINTFAAEIVTDFRASKFRSLDAYLRCAIQVRSSLPGWADLPTYRAELEKAVRRLAAGGQR